MIRKNWFIKRESDSNKLFMEYSNENPVKKKKYSNENQTLKNDSEATYSWLNMKEI